MRLQELRTHKLFRLFDHVISLNMDERITIIHGPNGYGKTAILRVIAAIFGSSLGALRSLPFDRLDLEFDDRTQLTVTKQTQSEKGNADYASLLFERRGCKPYRLSRTSPRLSGHLPLDAIEHFVPELERVGEKQWIERSIGEPLDVDDVFDRYGERLQAYFSLPKGEIERPDWFVKVQDSLNVHFIRANRLERSDWENSPRHGPPPAPTQVVVRYARELANHIQVTLARYAELSQSLDRSFPQRLVTSSTVPALSMHEIRGKLAELEQRRNELTDAGLLDKEEQTHFEVTAPIDESKADVLSVYINDVEEKLSVFKSLFAKIDLFKKILNRRFLFKTVSIDKNQGIVFLTPDETPLLPSSLSSGEQHEVVLLYQLLFEVKPQSLILIDEPELSLHIAWQEQFLKDLAQITSLSDFDVLIATHSPQIISDRWDLTVELRGPNGCESTSPTTQSLTR